MPPGADLARDAFAIDLVSRLTTDPLTAAKAIGDAGACEYDVACYSLSSNARFATNATTLSVVTDYRGISTSCTATLMNTDPFSATPYLLTAANCVKGQSEASSLNTLWSFEATGCGSRVSQPTTQLTGGATLLARTGDAGISFLLMNDQPPSDANYSGWNPTNPAVGQSVMAVHHPQARSEEAQPGNDHGRRHLAVRSLRTGRDRRGQRRLGAFRERPIPDGSALRRPVVVLEPGRAGLLRAVLELLEHRGPVPASGRGAGACLDQLLRPVVEPERVGLGRDDRRPRDESFRGLVHLRHQRPPHLVRHPGRHILGESPHVHGHGVPDARAVLPRCELRRVPGHGDACRLGHVRLRAHGPSAGMGEVLGGHRRDVLVEGDHPPALRQRPAGLGHGLHRHLVELRRVRLGPHALAARQQRLRRPLHL